jgi:hypothetical protein
MARHTARNRTDREHNQWRPLQLSTCNFARLAGVHTAMLAQRDEDQRKPALSGARPLEVDR